MSVPGPGPASSMLNLDEPDSTFDQPTSRQHLHPEVAGSRLVEPVHLVCRLRLGIETQRFGHRRLHMEGQLIRLNAGKQRGIVWILYRLQPVQSRGELKAELLLVERLTSGRRAKVQRVVGIDPNQDGVLGRAEVMPIP